MESLGINWLLLVSQIVFCLAIPVLIALGVVLSKAQPSSKFIIQLIGILTGWMTLFSVLFILMWIYSFMRDLSNSSAALIFRYDDAVNLLGSITVLLIVGLMAFYIPHAAKSPLIPVSDRRYYQIALFFLPFIIMPMYYSKFVMNGFVTTEKT
jgi:hypothetical protein